jgi:hypothetical protein
MGMDGAEGIDAGGTDELSVMPITPGQCLSESVLDCCFLQVRESTSSEVATGSREESALFLKS